MNLTPIAKAINTICHNLRLSTPSVEDDGAAEIDPETWNRLRSIGRWQERLTDWTPVGMRQFVADNAPTSTQRRLLEEQQQELVQKARGMFSLAPTWDFGRFDVPPAWPGSLDAYKETLCKGELGYILEYRFIENAGIVRVINTSAREAARRNLL